MVTAHWRLVAGCSRTQPSAQWSQWSPAGSGCPYAPAPAATLGPVPRPHQDTEEEGDVTPLSPGPGTQCPPACAGVRVRSAPAPASSLHFLPPEQRSAEQPCPGPALAFLRSTALLNTEHGHYISTHTIYLHYLQYLHTIYIATHRAHMQHSFVVSPARICTINFLPPSLGHNPTTQTQTPYHIHWPPLLCSVSGVELGDLISPHSQESGHYWSRGHRVSLDIARRRSGQVDIPDTSCVGIFTCFPASHPQNIV